MAIPVNLDRVTPIAEMVGEDQTETTSLSEMLERAEAYLKAFRWCPAIVERYLGFGIGGVVAVFLFRLATKVRDTDDWIWVVVGDLPSAYLVTDRATEARAALLVYCELMDEWAHAVLNGGEVDKTFPVKASATPEHAEMLLSRTQFIRDRIIPIVHASV
jgi:hypothetical protein